MAKDSEAFAFLKQELEETRQAFKRAMSAARTAQEAERRAEFALADMKDQMTQFLQRPNMVQISEEQVRQLAHLVGQHLQDVPQVIFPSKKAVN